MIHGGRDRSVRPPATLDAIAALRAADRLDEDVAGELAETYRLLRTVEHRVQMVEDAQTHLLPAEGQALDNVAQLHGLEDGNALLGQLRPYVERAGELFDGLTPETGARLSNDPDMLKQELKAIGFAEPHSAARHIADWRSAKARSLRSPPAIQAFEAMLPALLSEPTTDTAIGEYVGAVAFEFQGSSIASVP